MRLIEVEVAVHDESSALEVNFALGGVTVLLGRNSSGKTTILEAITTALQGPLNTHLEDWHGFRPRSAVVSLSFADAGPGKSLQIPAGLKRGLTSDEERALAESGGYRISVEGHVVKIAPLGSTHTLNTLRLPTAPASQFSDQAYISTVSPGLETILEFPFVIGTFETRKPSAVLEEVADSIRHGMREYCYSAFAHYKEVQGGLGAPCVDPWLIDEPEARYDPDQPLEVAPDVRSLLAAVELELNRLVPPFAGGGGRLRCEVLPIATWSVARRRVQLYMEMEGRTGARVEAEKLGAGSRRWINLALEIIKIRFDCLSEKLKDEALADYERTGVWGVTDMGGTNLRSLCSAAIFIDEPEAHLHPRAQHEVAQWLVNRAADNHTILVTTHSPALFALPTELASYHVLRLDHDGKTVNAEVSRDVLGGLDADVSSTGFGREAWFSIIRGVLIVEGQHDLDVIRFFFGDDLNRARLQMIAMRGGRNWRSIVDSEFLAASGLPVYVLFDNMCLDDVRAADSPKALRHSEHQWAWQLINSSTPRPRVEILPYDEPDILCAVPPACVTRRYPHVAGTLKELLGGVDDDWGAAITRYREEGSPGSFKEWVFAQLGIRNSASAVSELIKGLEGGDTPSRALRCAMAVLLASSANPGTMTRDYE